MGDRSDRHRHFRRARVGGTKRDLQDGIFHLDGGEMLGVAVDLYTRDEDDFAEFGRPVEVMPASPMADPSMAER